MNNEVKFEELENKVFYSITVNNRNENNNEGDEIVFITKNKETFVMCHEQRCCEDVWIEDICGDLNDLVGEPIIMARKSQNILEENTLVDKTVTWTFYTLATVKGIVNIRWCGTSNGFYSEDVGLYKIE